MSKFYHGTVLVKINVLILKAPELLQNANLFFQVNLLFRSGESVLVSLSPRRWASINRPPD